MAILSREDRHRFASTGYVKICGALEREEALSTRQEVWSELAEEFAMIEGRPQTWRAPPKGLKRVKQRPVESPRFRGAIDELLGPGRWHEPSNWGSFLVTFPSSELQKPMWHWDGPLDHELVGLLVFTFYSHVPHHGGGTMLLSGSQALVQEYARNLDAEGLALPHKTHRKRFLSWKPELAALAGLDLRREPRPRFEVDGLPLEVVELTGEPGDLVLCHPWMLHTPAGYNHHDQPRIMRAKFLW